MAAPEGTGKPYHKSVIYILKAENKFNTWDIFMCINLLIIRSS